MESVTWITVQLVWKVLLAAVLVLVVSAIVQEIKRPRGLPPTPGNRRPLPFVGNAFDIPKERSWVKYREWNEKYGPILTIWYGNVPIILIGDPEVRKGFALH